MTKDMAAMPAAAPFKISSRHFGQSPDLLS
jgi:hypothetical protein